MLIFHICPQTEWEAAQATGEYRADSLATEGFIHCSTPEQVLLPANRYFRGREGLILVALETERLQAELRFEEARNAEVYPHIYGPINLDATVKVIPFPPNPDGSFSLPDF